MYYTKLTESDTMIIREKYFFKIGIFYDIEFTKVITDIRRCGKK